MTDFTIDLSKFNIDDRELYNIFEPFNNAVLLPYGKKLKTGIFIVKSFGYSIISNILFLKILSKDGNDLIVMRSLSGRSVIYPTEVAYDLYPELCELPVHFNTNKISFTTDRNRGGVEISFNTHITLNNLLNYYVRNSSVSGHYKGVSVDAIKNNFLKYAEDNLEEDSLLNFILNTHKYLFITLSTGMTFSSISDIKPSLQSPFILFPDISSIFLSINSSNYFKNISDTLKKFERILVENSQIYSHRHLGGKINTTNYPEEFISMCRLTSEVISSLWEYCTENSEVIKMSAKLESLFKKNEIFSDSYKKVSDHGWTIYHSLGLNNEFHEAVKKHFINPSSSSVTQAGTTQAATTQPQGTTWLDAAENHIATIFNANPVDELL